MPTNRKVIDFKIHNLTEEQFQELKEAGQIDPNAIYCTPDETVANFEAVNARIDETNKKLNTFESGVNETVGVINTTIVNVDKKVDEAIKTEQENNTTVNARIDALEQTAGITSEQLNNKADSDLKNTPLQVDSKGKILVSGTTLAQSTNNRELRLQVGDDVTNGSLLALYGQDSTQGAAGFLLRACLEEGKYNDLVGRADGLLAWNGERIPCLEAELLPTIDGGYVWYKVYDDGFVIQGGRCTGTWEIEAGQEQVPYVTMAIPMNTTHTFPFFTCKELYCLPIGWYMENSTTLRPRFGSYTVKRTLTQFDWVAFGRKA